MKQCRLNQCTAKPSSLGLCRGHYDLDLEKRSRWPTEFDYGYALRVNGDLNNDWLTSDALDGWAVADLALTGRLEGTRWH